MSALLGFYLWGLFGYLWLRNWTVRRSSSSLLVIVERHHGKCAKRTMEAVDSIEDSIAEEDAEGTETARTPLPDVDADRTADLALLGDPISATEMLAEIDVARDMMIAIEIARAMTMMMVTEDLGTRETRIEGTETLAAKINQGMKRIAAMKTSA